MSDFRTLLMQFKEARARTIRGAFDTFLDEQIGITAGTRERASDSHNALRDFLRGVAEDDESFPRILRSADSDFLSGSFARHVKIWPLDDIDILFPIDATGLVYLVGGRPAPCTALSDGVLNENPFYRDRDRWWNGGSISSKKLINGFADVLRDEYPSTTRVRRGGEAVIVTLANDLGFDVVPCFSIKPHSPVKQDFYLIPDGNDGWIHTNPRLDKDLSDQLHRDNDRTLRRAVKLVKWWIGTYIDNRIPSYYAELAIMLAFRQRNRSDQKVAPLSMATLVAFRAVRDAVRAGHLQPLLNGAPPVERGDVTERDAQWLDADIDNCNGAVLAEQADNIEEALAAWRKVFGEQFPSS